jgi:hypothetical protein
VLCVYFLTSWFVTWPVATHMACHMTAHMACQMADHMVCHMASGHSYGLSHGRPYGLSNGRPLVEDPLVHKNLIGLQILTETLQL